MLRSIPLGLHQLWHQKLRMVAATLGITFAVIMIFMQLEFQEALYASAVRYHEAIDYDLVMLNPKTTYLLAAQQFPRNRLFQVQGIEGVESVTPVYLGLAKWRHPTQPLQSRNIFVMGFDPVDRGFDRLLTEQNHRQLQIPYHTLFDRLGRPEYGPVSALMEKKREVKTEINDREFTVVDTYAIGTSFAIDGSIIVSDLNFRRLFPERSESAIELGLIHLLPGNDPEAIKRDIITELPRDVRVLTRPEFARLEVDYWKNATPTGFVFGFGVIMGLVVGGIIVYQILYADVQDHLKEYATLLAIGYTHRYLKGVVLQEAIVLAVLGFLPGVAVAIALFDLTTGATHLPLTMSADNAYHVFALTLIMCIFSGLLALRKLGRVDPAEVF